jgi:hypothetical protein
MSATDIADGSSPQFWACRQLSALSGPAIFCDWEDFKFYVEDDPTKEQYEVFSTLQKATEYIQRKDNTTTSRNPSEPKLKQAASSSIYLPQPKRTRTHSNKDRDGNTWWTALVVSVCLVFVLFRSR